MCDVLASTFQTSCDMALRHGSLSFGVPLGVSESGAHLFYCRFLGLGSKLGLRLLYVHLQLARFGSVLASPLSNNPAAIWPSGMNLSLLWYHWGSLEVELICFIVGPSRQQAHSERAAALGGYVS